jgi:hypothetical protein
VGAVWRNMATGGNMDNEEVSKTDKILEKIPTM